jgi:hypothetical protein
MRGISALLIILGIIGVIVSGLIGMDTRHFEESGAAGQIANLIASVDGNLRAGLWRTGGIGMVLFAMSILIVMEISDLRAERKKSDQQFSDIIGLLKQANNAPTEVLAAQVLKVQQDAEDARREAQRVERERQQAEKEKHLAAERAAARAREDERERAQREKEQAEKELRFTVPDLDVSDIAKKDAERFRKKV